MKKVKVWSLLLMLLVTAGITIRIFAEQTENKPDISIRQLKSQTVLYTIYRGDYNKISQPIGNLFALAGKNGIYPRGSLCIAYLNNPRYTSSEHYLTEIRIPVGEDALKLTGTLGEMTDVKTLPAIDVAVVVKPEGVADSASIYEALGLWLHKKGYKAVDSPIEVFLAHAATGNYAQMKSEIMIPVVKFSEDKV